MAQASTSVSNGNTVVPNVLRWKSVFLVVVALSVFRFWSASNSLRPKYHTIAGPEPKKKQVYGTMESAQHLTGPLSQTKEFHREHQSVLKPWMLLRALRSSILQIENWLATDVELANVHQDLHSHSVSCAESGCNFSVTLLVKESRQNGIFALSSRSARPLTAPASPDDHVCALAIVNNPEKLLGAFGAGKPTEFHVTCSNIRAVTLTSSLLVVMLDRHTPAIESAVSSWVVEAEHTNHWFAFDVLVVAEQETLRLVQEAVDRVLSGQGFNSDMPLETLQLDESAITQPATGESSFLNSSTLTIWLADPKRFSGCMQLKSTSHPAGIEHNVSRDGQRVAWACALTVAAILVNPGNTSQGGTANGTSRNAARRPAKKTYGYVAMMEGAAVLCPGDMWPFLQGLFALRRAFSLIQCGRGLACQLLDSRDVAFWAAVMASGNSSLSVLQVLSLHARGNVASGRTQFVDRGVLAARHSVVGSGSECSLLLTRANGRSNDLLDDEEMYDQGSDCVPVLDEFSPCWDKRKHVMTLLRPTWYEGPDNRSKSDMQVQVLGKRRPEALFKTVSALLRQVRAECVTMHVDSPSDVLASKAEVDVVRVAQWFESVAGVRWRRGTTTFNPGLVRRLGFSRNHGNEAVVDRLVAMTYNALSAAFDERTAPQCRTDATVLLEDDLRPGPDMMSYFGWALAVMRRDETVKVATAWNDNAYNLRPGLSCAVQRGSYFMSIGWMLPRRTWDEVTTDKTLWPTRRESGGEVLAIEGGWEHPFLSMFHRRSSARSALFPSFARVRHQDSHSRGFSVAPLTQAQVFSPLQTYEGDSRCAFGDTSNASYDQALTAAMEGGQWSTLSEPGMRCWRDALDAEAPQVLVVAMRRTNYGGRYRLFQHILWPFTWVAGIGRTRGFYQDSLVVHAAQHSLLVVGPESPHMLQSARARSLFEAHAQTDAAVWQFFTYECLPSRRLASAFHLRIAAHMAALTPAEQQALPHMVPTIASANQTCTAACNSLARVCVVWGAVYAAAATHVVPAGGGDPVKIRLDTAAVEDIAGYGRVLTKNWQDLPVWEGAGMVLRYGLVRSFRCDAAPETKHCRVCPCARPEVAARVASRGLW